MSGIDPGPEDRAVASEGVVIRTVTVASLPLLVAAVPSRGAGVQLLATVVERGLRPLEAVRGVDLPRGAELGFVVDRDELRLVDPREQALLRAPRSGLDPGWLAAATRLKGTMTVVVTDLEVTAEQPVPELLAAVDAAAAAGRVHGAIVGLAEERPTLPLLFG